VANSFAWVMRRRRVEKAPVTIYEPGRLRTVSVGCLFFGVCFAVGWLFFEHWLIAFILGALGVWSSSKNKEAYIRKQKQLVSVQFEQMLYAVANALQAGKSVENSFLAAEADLKLLYRGYAPLLLRELEGLNRKVQHGTPLEKAIDVFQRRMDIPEVSNWANIFGTCKRTGGNLVHVMRHSSRLVVEKMSMERELSVMIAGKRFEAKALSIVPFLVIGMFKYGSPDYMLPLYEGPGRWVMALSLLIIGCGMRLAERMMRIEV